ncbi:MAG: hypothetical protein U0236_21725 [Nitrospira sp.]
MKTMRPGKPGTGWECPRRNVKEQLRSRLPRRLVSLLEEAGQVADRGEASLFVVGGCVYETSCRAFPILT